MSTPPRRASGRARAIAVLLLSIACPAAARAQEWPAGTLSAFGGRVTFGGEVTVTAGQEDRGYFNFTDYERSALRLGRAALVTAVRANPHLSFLLELRAEGDTWAGHWTASPYAAYVRVRPWASRDVDIDAGRVPTAFGAFLGRSYGAGNPLIGYPLGYQYLTSLRADSVPANADELLAARGRGWYIAYPLGAQASAAGVSVVSGFRYDTGVRLRVGGEQARTQLMASVTTGTLAYPGAADDNGAPQVAGRLVVRPTIGLVLGVSGARGAFVANEVRRDLPGALATRQYPQRAFGADAEYSRDHWLVRGEVIVSAWSLPAVGWPALDDGLSTRSILAEGRYTILPQLYAAARYDRLSFSTVDGSTGRDTWDANVSRVEAGIGYRVARPLTVKTSVQHVTRDGGRVRRDTLAAMQVVLWF
jgi:hypothetical protein